MNRPFALLPFLFVLVCLPSAAGQDRLDQLIQDAGSRFVAAPGHVGLAIGVVKGDERREYNFGSTSRSRADLPTGRTVFEIASVTKAFTGNLLARAVLDGKVKLDDPAANYLGGNFPNFTLNGATVSVADLAHHTAGLPKFVPSFKMVGDIDALYAGMTRERFLEQVRDVKLASTPGTVFSYSNAGAQLIGIILERVYGKSYSELVREFIAAPLHMDDTGRADGVEPGRIALGYDGEGQRMPTMAFWRTIPAAGALTSTIDDLLAFVRWNLDESDPVVALAHRVTFKRSTERGDDVGLFWFVAIRPDGSVLIRHPGGSLGTTSYCLVYPSRHVGFAMLANDASDTTERELIQLGDRMLKALEDN